MLKDFRIFIPDVAQADKFTALLLRLVDRFGGQATSADITDADLDAEQTHVDGLLKFFGGTGEQKS